MALTLQQVLDRARKPLNDRSKVRYPDADLLEYANDAVRELRRRRPDLFYGQYSSLPAELTSGQNLPVDDEFLPAVCDYIRARAEFKDDEASMREKAATFFRLFEGAL